MTDELENLRPEVREAVEHCDRNFALAPYGSQRVNWPLIRAELLSLVGDLNATRLSSETFAAKYQCMRERAERAEAELAALKARIAGSPMVTVVMDERETPIISCDLPEGTRVALMKVEDDDV